MVINFVLLCGNDNIILSDRIFIAAQDKNNMLYEMFDDLCTVYPGTTEELYTCDDKQIEITNNIAISRHTNSTKIILNIFVFCAILS